VKSNFQKQLLLIFLLLGSIGVSSLHAQNDCVEAIVVCGNSGYQNLPVAGFGTQELFGTNNCGSQENNSIWFDVTVSSAGTLAFTLTPESTAISEDYDFFIYGPNVDCNNIGQAIRCSTTNPIQAGLTNNLTGMSDSETDTSEGPGANGNSFVSSIDANVGDRFFLVVDRPIGTSNFSLEWTGTATFDDLPVNSVTPGSADLTECDTTAPVDDGFHIFDLTVNNTAFIDGQANVDVTYHLTEGDAIADLNPITDPTNYTNISSPQNIHVRLFNTVTGCFIIDVLQIDIANGVAPGTPEDLIACDSDGDGFEIFDLNANANTIINGAANTAVTFHRSEMDAMDGVNDVSFNYTNQVAFAQETLWARLEELTDNCFEVVSFTLDVFEDAIATQPSDINVCDDDGDGFFEFDLSALQDANVLNGLNPATFNVFYYGSESDAINNSDPLPFPYVNPTPFINQTIFVRAQNILAPTICFDTTSFQLTVGNQPLPSQPTDYEFCDNDSDGDDTDGTVQDFLLSTKDNEILTGLDASLYTVSYHLSSDDANTNTNPIDKNSLYENTTPNSQTIYVRVQDDNNASCFDATLSFNLIVHALPTVNPSVTLSQCDTDTDGFSFFNLNEAASIISADHLNESFVFYQSLADAQNDNEPIDNPIAYENQTETTDTVWVRTINTFGCYRISEINLIISTTGIPPSFQPTFTECDDFLDLNGDDNENNDNTDGITFFDFSSVTDDVEALFPPTQLLVITYYQTEADALAEQNAIINTSSYRNINSPFTQEIYIRVDSQLDNECLGLGPFLTLNVDPVPTANPVDNLELCDYDIDGDAFNGIVQGFNLDSQTADIIGAQNPANFSVSYHLSSNEAASGVNAITNTSDYENIVPNQQTIYVRIFNNVAGCFSSQTSFDLIVNPLPIANPVADLEVCDDNSDGSAQNGFAQTFNLESQTPDVLGGQDSNEFSVTYHASLADAEQGVLPLLTPFSNSVPFSQTIYVRVSNQTTGCANGITSFEVIVNPEPMALEISNVSECDDDMDGFDTNGIIQTFDLDNEIEAILGPNQSPNDYTVTFHSTQANATSGNAPLISPYQNSQADQQTIYVRVVNNATGCVNDDLTFELIVNPLPTFTVNPFEIICLNELPLTLEIQSSLTIYDYVWEDDQGTTFMGEEIEIRRGGTYSVTATSTDGTSCSRTQEIFVQESNIANITADAITIIDDSDNNSITINTTNLGIGDYEYSIQNDNGFGISFQDEPFFENLEGGIYTIFVRDKNGCGTVSISVPVVQFPKFFTPNNDSRNDTWQARGFNSTFFLGSQIFIFNRYGKQLAELDIDGDGWNGLFNGRPMPSDDYWFLVRIVIPNGSVEERQGHFSLLRK